MTRPTLIIAIVGSVAGACVPTASRTNARIEPGFDVALTGGAQFVGEGEDENGETTEASGAIPHLEIDAQWGHTFDDGSGLAVQLKLPATIVFTSVDLYYAFSSSGPLHMGFGVEVGALPGLYAVFTEYLADDSVYVTFTPRALLARSRSENAVLLNPQLAFGFSKLDEVSGFVSYAYHTGQGFDFDIDLFCPNDRNDYRKQYVLAGASIRF